MHQNTLLEGRYAIYASVLALGIITIGNIIIGRKFMHQNWPLEGTYADNTTVLALGIVAIGKSTIGRKFMHHLWKACVIYETVLA